MTDHLNATGTAGPADHGPSRRVPEAPKASRGPRILMPSTRAFRRFAYQGGLYEAQDILMETDDVDLLCLEPGPGFRLREKWQRKLMWRDRTKKLVYVNPGLRTVRLTRSYDLFIAVCQNWWDFLHLNAIKGWRERCAASVCWIDEMWAAWVPRYRNWVHFLDEFDHVVLNLGGSVRAVEGAIGRPCHWVPGGIDALRFSPYPGRPTRVIDVYSIGRKWEGVHRALLDLVEKRGIFYIYDTVNVNDTTLPDYRQHRDLISGMAKRSRYFTVAPAKMDTPDEAEGQIEVGSRYFEGAAAGAVLIGEKPDSEPFRRLFDWPDAIIPIRTDGSDLVEVLSELESQPERRREISRRNAVESLLRHDWIHRWKQIFEIAGMTPTAAMGAREQRLRNLAEAAGRDDRP